MSAFRLRELPNGIVMIDLRLNGGEVVSIQYDDSTNKHVYTGSDPRALRFIDWLYSTVFPIYIYYNEFETSGGPYGLEQYGEWLEVYGVSF